MVSIYVLSSSESPDNIRYVGKTNEKLSRRLSRHLSNTVNESNYKSNWINSVFNKGYSVIITEIDIVEDDDWVFYEKYWIEQFRNWGFNLTNSTEGGEGVLLNEELIDKRNNTNRENYLEKIKEKIEKYSIKEENGVWFGYRICDKKDCGSVVTYKSEKLSNLISSIKRVEKENRGCKYCSNKGEKSHFYGKKINDGHIKKEKYGKIVLQLDKNDNILNEYLSIREASEKTKIDRKSISRCCNKKPNYKSAGGFKFKFKDNNNE